MPYRLTKAATEPSRKRTALTALSTKYRTNRTRRMSEAANESEETEEASGPVRRRQLRIHAEIQAAEAQKLAARAAVKNARYMLLAVVIAAISTLIATAGSVFSVLSKFYLTPH